MIFGVRFLKIGTLNSCSDFVFLQDFHGLNFSHCGHSSLCNTQGEHLPLIVLDTSFSMAIMFLCPTYFLLDGRHLIQEHTHVSSRYTLAMF